VVQVCDVRACELRHGCLVLTDSVRRELGGLLRAVRKDFRGTPVGIVCRYGSIWI